MGENRTIWVDVVSNDPVPLREEDINSSSLSRPRINRSGVVGGFAAEVGGTDCRGTAGGVPLLVVWNGVVEGKDDAVGERILGGDGGEEVELVGEEGRVLGPIFTRGGAARPSEGMMLDPKPH